MRNNVLEKIAKSYPRMVAKWYRKVKTTLLLLDTMSLLSSSKFFIVTEIQLYIKWKTLLKFSRRREIGRFVD